MISSFLEKPASVAGLPDDPGRVFASMGNYIFRTERLLEALHVDAEIRIPATTWAAI